MLLRIKMRKRTLKKGGKFFEVPNDRLLLLSDETSLNSITKAWVAHHLPQAQFILELSDTPIFLKTVQRKHTRSFVHQH